MLKLKSPLSSALSNIYYYLQALVCVISNFWSSFSFNSFVFKQQSFNDSIRSVLDGRDVLFRVRVNTFIRRENEETLVDQESIPCLADEK